PLPELPIQYADYALWQRSWLRGEALERQIRYWKDRLAGAPAALDLPTDRPRPPVQNFRGASLFLALPKVLSDDLDALARREGATLFMVLLAAFKIVLSRWSGQQDIVVGTPVAGRTDRQTEGLIGFFVNMLALRADLAGDPSFRDFLGRVKETALGAYAHQDLPFEKLVEELNPARDLSRPPVFQVLFALQNYPEESLTLSSLRLDRIAAPAESVSSKLDLSIYMSESAAGLFGAIEYASDLFEPATIERLAGHFQTVLQGIAATPAARLSDLPLLSEAERRCLAVEWNATAADCPSDKCIHDLIAEQAVRRPDAVAVVASGTEEALSYGELNARADRLAHYLQSSLGVGPDVVVGLCMARSPAMLVGLLGILKAGGAYLPLDPTYPRDRLAFMLSNSGAELVLADADLAAAVELPTSKLPVLDLADAAVAERLAAMPDRPATRSRVCPDNLAYVIYTSGSTGAPKGVMVAHRGVVNMLSWLADHVGMTADDAVPQKMPLGFDFSVQELFLPLTAGGRLLLAPPAAAEGGAAEQVQAQLSVDDAATVVSFVPSVLQAWLGSRSPDPGALTARAVICCGEALPTALVDRLLLTSGWSGALYNLYGPTEASVFATAWNCGEAENGGGEIAPIGRPVWNTQIHVLDDLLSPVPVGAVGEICIGGVQLARGYLGQPGLTAERFVPNPFGRGERLYRTGDLAKRRADGVLVFLGRLDDQVKVRGFRIELGEIEAALTALPEVREAVAVAREDRPGEKRLVAYVVGALGSSELDLPALRAALGRSLPEYMVPSHVVVLEALPLNANGKIDRKALPPPDLARGEVDYVAPRGATEEIVAGIWSEILGVDRVGAHDNFFDLGGHSLLATQVMSKLRTAVAIELPLRALFEAPTVAGLSSRLDAAATGTAAHEAPPPAIERVGRDGALPLPLSFAQQRLWFLDQLEPGIAFYNMPAAVRLRGVLDVDALRRTLNEVVRR
ncbi:MAG TPA: amino acid adenylation domain-containing protein, partial [Stellaceae bacterium]